MRTLSSVGAAMRSVCRYISVSTLVAALGLSAMQAHAQWQDPLETPALSTLIAHKSLLLDVTAAGDRYVAVGSRGHIILSDDKGRTWVQAKVPVMTTLTAVKFADANTGYAVGHDAVVLKTEDGGKTWVKKFDGFRANEMVLESAKKAKEKREAELDAASQSGNDDLIYEAEEALENATFALEDAQYDYDDRSTKPLMDLWFKNANEGFVIGAYGMIFKTLDGGDSWLAWSSKVENPNRFHLNSIAQMSDSALVIAGEAGLILTSKNLGDTWQMANSPYDGSFFGVIALQNNVQLAFGLRGNVVRSDNYGQSWDFVDTHSKQTLIGGTDHLGLTAYLVGNAGTFLKGIAAGTKWESTTRTGRSNAASIVETNPGEFILVGEGGVQIIDETGTRLPVEVKSVEG